MPRRAVFRASVAFRVKQIRLESGAAKRAARLSRQEKTIRAASWERRCPERPGLPPTSRRKCSMASGTPGGLGKEVAPLSM
jgi:hypothetical protein